MKVEQLIREKISSLSAGQKKVAEYILQHLDSFSYSTLAKLSKEILWVLKVFLKCRELYRMTSFPFPQLHQMTHWITEISIRTSLQKSSIPWKTGLPT